MTHGYIFTPSNVTIKLKHVFVTTVSEVKDSPLFWVSGDFSNRQFILIPIYCISVAVK